MIYTVTVKPDYPAIINRQGRFVHIVAATTVIDLRFIGVKNGTDDRSVMRQGMAIDLENPIDELVISSEVEQTVQIWLSETKLTYSLSETVQAGSRGLNNYQAAAFKGLTNKILDALPMRGKSLICPDVDIRIGGANLSNDLANGVLIKANETMPINTQAAIYAYTDVPGYEAIEVADFAEQLTTAKVGGSSSSVVGGAYSDDLGMLIIGTGNAGFKTMLIDDLSYGQQSAIAGANFNVADRNVFDNGADVVALVLDGVEIKPIYINKATLGVTLGDPLPVTGGGTFWGVTCSAISPDRRIIASVLRWSASDTFELAISVDGATHSVELLDDVSGAWPEEVVVRSNGDVFIFYEGGVIRRKIAGAWDQVVAGFTIVGHSNDEKLMNGNDSYLFLSADEHMVYRSSDNGVTWGIIYELNKTARFTRLEVIGSVIYALSSAEGVFIYSSDNGENFISSFGTDASPFYQKLHKTFVNKSGVYIVPYSGDLIQLAGSIKILGGAVVNIMSEEN